MPTGTSNDRDLNQKEKEFSAIRKILMNFRTSLHGIKYFISALGPVARARDKRAKKTEEQIKEEMRSILLSGIHTLAERDKKPEKRVSVKEKKLYSTVNKIISLVKDYDYAGANVALDDELHRGLLLKSSFMMMVATFDFLLSDILHCYYEKYPQALNEDMVLSLGDLRKCTNIHEAIQMVMDKKVETVLFKNFAQQILFFEDDLKIETANTIIGWDLINEAYQRRNILVHNSGIVNNRYLKNVGALPGVKKVKLGERLGVSGGYFLQAYYEIFSGGIVLAQNCWRKWFKKDLSGADSTLIDCINKELLQQSFGSATNLCLYSRGIKTDSEEARFDLDSLLCQLLKILGLQEQLTKEIKKLEKNASSNKRLAVIAALKDDKEAFYVHVKNAAKNGEMYRDDFELAAVYEDFRGDTDFKTKLDEIFKHG